MSHETVFTLEATPVKFGPGAVNDAGWELRRLVDGAVMQQRLLAIAPREPSESDLRQIVIASLRNW